MSFETYNKGNIQKSDSVNSRGVQMKNRNGIEGSSLVAGYWDDKLTVTLHPVLPNPTEKQVYNYDEKIMVAMRLDKVVSLHKALKIIDLAITEGREQSVGITLNDNMIVVSTKLKEQSLHVVLHVCRKMNPETRIPGELFSYTFIKDEEIIEGYNPANGQFQEVREIQSEYETFKTVLQEFIQISTQASVHSARYFDKYYRNSIMDKVTKIGQKTGALDSGNFKGSYNNGGNTFANPGVNAGAGSGYTPTTSLEDLDQAF